MALNWSDVGVERTDRKRRLSELRGLLMVIKDSVFVAAGCVSAA